MWKVGQFKDIRPEGPGLNISKAAERGDENTSRFIPGAAFQPSGAGGSELSLASPRSVGSPPAPQDVRDPKSLPPLKLAE